MWSVRLGWVGWLFTVTQVDADVIVALVLVDQMEIYYFGQLYAIQVNMRWRQLEKPELVKHLPLNLSSRRAAGGKLEQERSSR